MNRAILLMLLGTGCNQYEYFNIAGYVQADYSNDADVIFVIDNSQSMVDESASLALNFNAFIQTLTSEDGAAQNTDGLSDAVSNTIDASQERGRYIDYQLGITTTTAKLIGGDSTGLEPGEGGWLLGDPTIISKWDPDVEDAFRRNLLCEATYWDEDEVPSDLSYVCGDEPDQITQEYLDCECGLGEWEGNAGSGDEEPLEAALLALCRSVDSPPELCFEGDAEHSFTSADINSNNTADRQLLREDATTVVVIVGDEGDDSWRLPEGEETPDTYIDAFAEFERPIRMVTIGPNYNDDDGSFPCNSGGAQTWMVERLQAMADETNGFFAPLEEQINGDCEQADFAEYLAELGQLINNLLTAFQLQSIPDIETIRVYVDGLEVSAAAETDVIDPDADTLEYTRGWSYDSAQNAVAFWGENVPDYNQDVRIYYRPLVGKPRELPF
ncbi:MAG: hypothetical protein P8R54_02520 [Myxococcota bacterium]|nr:hypothetical protein [Myxococcota bacterium]